MINCYFNYSTGFFHFKIDMDCIYKDDIIALLKKQYYCNYNSHYKEWLQYKPIVVKTILIDLNAYDEISISEEDKELLEYLIYPKDSTYKIIKKKVNTDWLKKYPPIKGKIPFEDYQLNTMQFCLNRNRFIQDLCPGSGKSYIMEGILSSIQNIKHKRILWVCRPEGVYITYLKVLHFLQDFYKEEDLGIVTTDDREIENYFDKKIIFTNYTTFKLSHNYYKNLKRKKVVKKVINKEENNKNVKKKKRVTYSQYQYIDFSKWEKPENLICILDEGQSLKNYPSQQAQALHTYKNCFDIRGVLSGSLGYKVLDYFSICKFLIPETIPYSFSEFRNYMIKKGTYEAIPERVKEFKEKVLNNIQISYDEKVLDLPPFKEEEIIIQMNNKMNKMYQQFINDFYNKKKEEQDITGKSLENSFMYLSMFTSDPSLVIDKLNKTWDIKENPKIEIIESYLNKWIDDENRKVIIWCQHPRVINELKKIFKKYNPFVVHGDEKTSIRKKERDNLIQDFRTSKDRNLLICSYVLNSSIDLYEATRVIYFDNITDNDQRNQSKKRPWRIGQKESVEAYYLLFDDSIDIYIYYEILQRKDKIRNLMINKKELTLEDYKKVFKAKVTNYWNPS